MSTVRILVTGATGYVGSRLVTTLLDAGHDVVVTSRRPDKLAAFGRCDDVTGVALDALDEESAEHAFRQAGRVDVVYYLVHGIGQPGFRDIDNRAAANIAAAAKNTGVRRIVYLGGFVPDGDELSEHLASRAEVAHALSVDGGPEVVWLGAAMIIGSGSTSFEMLRYVADRFVLLPMPDWMDNPIEPISIRDVLHYLTAAADVDRVPAGAYDISGPDTTTYRELLVAYGRASGKWRAGIPIRGVDTAVVSRMAAIMLPVPGGLVADLVESLDHPMMASEDGLHDLVPDPPGGLVGIDEAVTRSLASRRPCPVNALADPHHLADTDPPRAGGDTLRIRRLARSITPSIARPALGLLGVVPGPVAGALRTGLDALITLTPKVRTAWHHPARATLAGVEEVVCPQCVGKTFSVLADDEEGFAQTQCLTCGNHAFIADSAVYWQDAMPDECACPCGGEAFEVAVGFALPADEVQWISVGLRCIRDGSLAALSSAGKSEIQ